MLYRLLDLVVYLSPIINAWIIVEGVLTESEQVIIYSCLLSIYPDIDVVFSIMSVIGLSLPFENILKYCKYMK